VGAQPVGRYAERLAVEACGESEAGLVTAEGGIGCHARVVVSPRGKVPLTGVRVSLSGHVQSIDVSAGGPTDTAGLIDPVTRALLAARDGDEIAAGTFVRSTQAEVWRFVAALAGRDAADDLTQDTYLRAFRALSDFAGRSTARTWLLGIARRACADHIRSLTRLRRLDDRLAAQPRLTHVPDQTGLLAATDLLRELPDDRRSAFVLTQVIGLSYDEAADVEQVPVGTIRSRVARARAHLVEAIQTARTA
jgi:RNA polymerase sigma-70 factor (ECF subfamily)